MKQEGGLNASCGAEQDWRPPDAGIQRDSLDADQETACLIPVPGWETPAHSSRVRQRQKWSWLKMFPETPTALSETTLWARASLSTGNF